MGRGKSSKVGNTNRVAARVASAASITGNKRDTRQGAELRSGQFSLEANSEKAAVDTFKKMFKSTDDFGYKIKYDGPSNTYTITETLSGRTTPASEKFQVFVIEENKDNKKRYRFRPV